MNFGLLVELMISQVVQNFKIEDWQSVGFTSMLDSNIQRRGLIKTALSEIHKVIRMIVFQASD